MLSNRIIRKVLISLVIWAFVLILMFFILPREPGEKTSQSGEHCRDRVYYWLDHMERWEEQYGVPKELQYGLMLQESGGQNCIDTGTGQYEGGRELKAIGLFQVVDYSSRVRKYGDLMNPENNARAGLEYLTGCNREVTGGSVNWDYRDVLLDTLWCYHDGLKNYRDGYKSDVARRHGGKVLSIASGRGYQIKDRPRLVPTAFMP